jgi:hypothetical protein
MFHFGSAGARRGFDLARFRSKFLVARLAAGMLTLLACFSGLAAQVSQKDTAKIESFEYNDPAHKMTARVQLPDSLGRWNVENPWREADKSLITQLGVFITVNFQSVDDPKVYGLVRTVFDLQGFDCATLFSKLDESDGLTVQAYSAADIEGAKGARLHVFQFARPQDNLIVVSKVVCDSKSALNVMVVAPNEPRYLDAIKTILGTAEMRIPFELASVQPLTAVDTDVQAWSKVRASSDPSQLMDFLARYPASPLVIDARERLSAIERERLQAQSERERLERLAQEQAELERLPREQAGRERLAREEAERRKIEQTVNPSDGVHTAMVAPNPTSRPAPASPSQLSGLVQEIKKELKRVGCYAGPIDESWSAAAKSSAQRFAKYAKLPATPGEPAVDFLHAIRATSDRVCPLECNVRQVERDGQCVAKTCPGGSVPETDGTCGKPQERSKLASRSAEAPPSATQKTSGGPPEPKTVRGQCIKELGGFYDPNRKHKPWQLPGGWGTQSALYSCIERKTAGAR